MNHKMNPYYSNNATRGSALVAVLIFGALISISAAFAYRSTMYQNHMAQRSQDYLTALGVAEAGAELAMVQLNKPAAAAFTGWTGSDKKILQTTITDDRNQAIGETRVQVSNLGGDPRVISTAYVPSRENPKTIRTVQLATKSDSVPAPFGEYGLFAFGNLEFKGNETIDSFDSSIAAYKAGGSGNNASVASIGNMSFEGSQLINGNAQAGGNMLFKGVQNIKGNIQFGGSFLPNGDTKIGGTRVNSTLRLPERREAPTVDRATPSSDNNNKVVVKPQYYGDTKYGVPSGGKLEDSNSIITLPAPGTYHFSNFNPSGTSVVNIEGSGDVKIHVDKDFNLGSTPTTNIQKSGSGGSGPNVTIIAKDVKFVTYGDLNVKDSSKLNVFAETLTGDGSKKLNVSDNAKVVYSVENLKYSGAAMLNMKGSGNPGLAANLLIYASKIANFGGGSQVSGVLYAPSADLTISGGFEWYGGVIANNIKIPGGPGVHIDEDLFKPQAGSGAFVTAWTEVAPKTNF